MRLKLFYIIFILFSCQQKENTLYIKEVEKGNLNEKSLLIIFDRRMDNTEYIDRSSPTKKSFQFWRKDFESPYDDPNLHISVFHGLDQDTLLIKRKNLDKMNVWFDSEMGYMDWFRLDFEKYYIIYQDEYLVKGSLDPEYSFSAYEVKIQTGGVE